MIKESKIYQAYYTKSTPIVDHMVESLKLEASDRVFEPCGGDGVFIESILARNEFANIDVCELNIDSYNTLTHKFDSYKNVNVRLCDTLLDSDLIFNSTFGGIYDKIIANPPYGAWQDYDKRDKLKSYFPNLYTKETYTLFLYRCIELLKSNGILSFIIPDTFLNLHMHKEIRKHILTRTRILELCLFPSSFFPGVNFGYANLSIITLQKIDSQETCLDSSFPVINNFKTVEQLISISDADLKTTVFRQRDVFRNPDHALLISNNSQVAQLINKAEYKVGDIASCVTGFYSGDDKRFLKVISPDLKNGKNYDLVEIPLVNRDYCLLQNILDGIDGPNHFIPIVKGGSAKYLKPEGWFMTWSKEAVNHYKKDKKARFQNPQFYFKFGIGVPMISSSSITASLIENKLFDQSIVGIFPKDKDLTFYLLAFFNSPTCNKLIRTINPSANNPANYIKKIPFIIPTSQSLTFVSDLVLEIISQIKEHQKFDEAIENQLHCHFKELYGF